MCLHTLLTCIFRFVFWSIFLCFVLWFVLFYFFFFKQKTAYEIRLSLVGSEMCIRDRYFCASDFAVENKVSNSSSLFTIFIPLPPPPPDACLLYTSDAADEEDSVDLGGRRIIKKKKKKTQKKKKKISIDNKSTTRYWQHNPDTQIYIYLHVCTQ